MSSNEPHTDTYTPTSHPPAHIGEETQISNEEILAQRKRMQDAEAAKWAAMSDEEIDQGFALRLTAMGEYMCSLCVGPHDFEPRRQHSPAYLRNLHDH